MRKTIVFLLALLLLIPKASAEERDATVLRFGSDEPIYSIYASYEVGQDVTDLTVTFAEHVKNYAYCNFVNGTLWISVASARPIDSCMPIGWVTGTDSEGQKITPVLELTSLRFNGEAAARNLMVDSVQADLTGDALHVTVSAEDYFRGNYMLLVAAYDSAGKLLASDVKTAIFEERQEIFTASLTNGASASCVKAFFMSSDWTPVVMAEDQEIHK